MSFIYFVFITYAFAFLAAEARIFGADTTAWVEIHEDPTAEDREWLAGLGILRLRQRVLPWRFVREHLSCYFCMGVWAGPAAHVLLWHLYHLRENHFYGHVAEYALWHPGTTTGWVLGLAIAVLLGSAGSYVVNTVLLALEKKHG